MRMASGDSMAKSESPRTFEVECQKCGLQFRVPIDRFKDEEYKNWLKASLCLQYTKEGLEGFVETTSKEFYTSIESEILSANNCTCLCSLIDFRNSNFNCPSTTCDALRSALVQSSRKQRLQWENTTLADMLSSPVNVMKLFMPRMCRTYSGPQEADSTAILALMCECLMFSSKLRVPDAVNDVRESRNAVMHSGTMRINNNELSQHASNFVALLSDPYHLKKDEKCIEAIRHIQEVCEKKIQINLVEIETKVMGQHKNLLDGELNDLQQIVESTTLTEDEMESANLRAKKLEEKESKMKVMMEFYNIDTASVASHIATAGALHQEFEKKLQEVKQKAYDNELEKLRQLVKTEQQGKIQLATENVKLTQMYTDKVHIGKLQTDLQTHENETRDITNNITKMLQEEQSRSSLLQDKLHSNESMVQVLKKHVEDEKSRADELTNTIYTLQTDLQTQNNEMKEVRSTICSLKNDLDKSRSDAEQRNESHIIDEMREHINSINKALQEEQSRSSLLQDRLQYNESMVQYLAGNYETHSNHSECNNENTHSTETEQDRQSHNEDGNKSVEFRIGANRSVRWKQVSSRPMRVQKDGYLKIGNTRSWENVYVVVKGLFLCCYKDEKHARQDPNHEQQMYLYRAKCEDATDYAKQSNVFRLSLSNGATYLFMAKDQDEMGTWIGVIRQVIDVLDRMYIPEKRTYVF